MRRSQKPEARSQKLWGTRVWALVLGVMAMVGVVFVVACNSAQSEKSYSSARGQLAEPSGGVGLMKSHQYIAAKPSTSATTARLAAFT